MSDLKRAEPKYPDRITKAVVPIPPSKNHAFIYRGFKKIPKKATRDYKEKVRNTIADTLESKGWEMDKEDVWYYLDLYFYMPDRRRRDSHNSLEVLMDSLEECLFQDDYFVMPRIMKVELDRDNPRLELKLHPIKYED